MSTPPLHTYLPSLGLAFGSSVPLQPVPQTHWLLRNTALAQDLHLADWLQSKDALQVLAGNGGELHGLPVSHYASVYSGHQFGVWAGQLGDGRAVLIGQAAGQELQLKGAGRTPYSRMGDGRAVLRSSIREYLASEAMHGLGIPTTRALALVGSPLPVMRETPETAAIVTRVAPSFIRFGHFEHFAANDEIDRLRTLADAVIAQHYPACTQAAQPYLALLAQVVERTADLLAQWQAVGFCHGVMNTDNMSILGLTLDYGPFQFLDGFNAQHICNHSDTHGRYRYSNQPNMAYWNLFCLGQSLMPLLEPALGMQAAKEAIVQTLESYIARYHAQFGMRMAAKLGLLPSATVDTADADEQSTSPLAQTLKTLLPLMQAEGVDWTIFWRRLSHAAASGSFAPVQDLFTNQEGSRAWLHEYQALLQQYANADTIGAMLHTNPALVLRNHLAQTAIEAAQQGDLRELERLARALQKPYVEDPQYADYATFPPAWAQSISISCSS